MAAGFTNIRIHHRLAPSLHSDVASLPSPEAKEISRVIADCNACGQQLAAYRAKESGVGGTFFRLAMSHSVQLNCKCGNNASFTESEIPQLP